MSDQTWSDAKEIGSISYVCWHCGNLVASNKGWRSTPDNLKRAHHIVICQHCHRPTYQDGSKNFYPGAPYGDMVEGITDELVRQLYEEARKDSSSGCFTSAVMCCRKILMSVAVVKGATKNKQFEYYVDYLVEKNYIPADARQWVDAIRSLGNKATHEIKVSHQKDAEIAIIFTGMLLKQIFEFPKRLRDRANAPTPEMLKAEAEKKMAHEVELRKRRQGL